MLLVALGSCGSVLNLLTRILAEGAPEIHYLMRNIPGRDRPIYGQVQAYQPPRPDVPSWVIRVLHGGLIEDDGRH